MRRSVGGGTYSSDWLPPPRSRRHVPHPPTFCLLPCLETRSSAIRLAIAGALLFLLLLCFAPATGRWLTGVMSHANGPCAEEEEEEECDCWKAPANLTATGRARWCAYIGALFYANVALLALLVCNLFYMARSVLQEIASASQRAEKSFDDFEWS